MVIILDICWSLEFVKLDFDSRCTHSDWPEAIVFVSDGWARSHLLHTVSQDSFIDDTGE